jgi:hypothetical protein
VCVVGNELCHKCDCVSDPIDRVLQVQSSGGRLLKETVRSMQCGRMCVWSFMCGTVVIIASDCDVEPVAEGHRVWGRGRWQRSKQNTHTITHPTHTLPTHTTAHKAAQVTQACRNASKTWLGRNAYAHLLLRRHGQGPTRVPGPLPSATLVCPAHQEINRYAQCWSRQLPVGHRFTRERTQSAARTSHKHG